MLHEWRIDPQKAVCEGCASRRRVNQDDGSFLSEHGRGLVSFDNVFGPSPCLTQRTGHLGASRSPRYGPKSPIVRPRLVDTMSQILWM